MTVPRVAVVGGGQLARMMAGPATALGVHLRVLVETAGSSAAQAVADAPVGAAADTDAVGALVEGADVLTFEHEHVPGPVLDGVLAAGVPVRPAPHALLHAQDKIVMRTRLTELGVPCPRWAPVADAAALAAFLADVGGRAVVKTARGGYDGKGVRVVADPADVADWLAAAQAGTGPALLAEELVPFRRELAALVARRPSGEVAPWPVVESVQTDGVCDEVVAPAPDLHEATARQALDVARRVVEGLDVTGVLAVELFEVDDLDGGAPRVLVNELAMRPHNSGHWTIDGSVTSQFEQHLRAVLDLPLGSTAARAPWTVMANVLGSALDAPTDALADVLAADPAAKVHLYGKDVRPGRKLGHVTVAGDDLADVRARARAAAALLRGEHRAAHAPTEDA
ncbi:5-(carboxyamino)imidazole ribonucleotide synthase [Cellulomonas oligotrophica]|uniref:N5-carboxyaminoimidazole ribonucleotide synthase n=1 Tax=Cellulomonas oligotrophica TaxID=931536 RepID=A0A7Y9FDL0_9CELL|nr:5-(carboxyamino)imidazole ribonucleotide synthase [Cellulomonas oligotrophica]NYD85244.1 5-(carboxyamino)imidazole ribonucleotide synthase [Cellulomonas oligotrophica]GIG33320.1 N5-carboxyaminoimidazole ribonucleotide synthase [Cellulomonas oligotrophica]